MNKKFNENVKKAKTVLKTMKMQNSHRMKVAQLALSVCVVYRGGRHSVSKANIRLFAEKAGINPSTLYEWTRYYRYIYCKLGKTEKRDCDETPTDAFKYMIKGLTGAEDALYIKNRFNKARKDLAKNGKWRKYIKNMEAILFNLKNISRISEMETEVLMDVLEKAKLMVLYIEQEMKNRNEQIPKKIKRPTINWDEFWTEEVGLQ